MRLRFGAFTFDDGRRLLFRGPAPVELSPKAFQLLGLLLMKRPSALSKAEILDTLWPGTFVSEGNLASLVNEIRQGLGEKARASGSIRTVHGFGYAFDQEVTEEAEDRSAPARHRLLWGQRVILLSEGENLIGRTTDAPIWIGHESVSRAHARVIVTGNLAELEDLGSKNGTWRGEERLTQILTLTDGDEFRVGRVTLTYHNSLADGRDDTVTDMGWKSGPPTASARERHSKKPAD